MMIRACCALLCLSLLSSCNASSAGRMLMMPVNLGKGLLNTAGRTLGRVVETDSQAPKPETEALPKPHSRLPTERKSGTQARVAVVADRQAPAL